MKLRITSAQMSVVQIHFTDSAHDDDRQDWWPKQIDASQIEFPVDHCLDVCDLLTEAANSESDGPGGDMGACRAATNLCARVFRERNP